MRNFVKISVLAVFLTAAVYFLIPSTADGKEAASNSGKVIEGVPLPAVQDACPGAQEHSLQLPSSVPPSQFVDFEKKILAFLQNGDYCYCVTKISSFLGNSHMRELKMDRGLLASQ
jgi:hypothetical protein